MKRPDDTTSRASAPAGRTFLEHGTSMLRSLSEALGFGPRIAEVERLFGQLLHPWGDRQIGRDPAYPSDVGDDHSPFEFSIAFGAGEPELRVLCEAQGDRPSLQSNLVAARRLTHRLAQMYDLPLDRLRRIEDLLLPAAPRGEFVLWHAVSFWPGRPPAFKIYLNPRVCGDEHAHDVVASAMDRLGFGRAWSRIAAGERDGGRDVLAFLSLDLDREPGARAKVYYRHYDATAAQLETAFGRARYYEPGEVTALCETLAGERGPFRSKPLGSCYAFVEGDDARPSYATLYFPAAFYAAHDEQIRERIERWLDRVGLETTLYLRALAAVTRRPLQTRTGLQSYVSSRQEGDRRRATVYLCPELYPGVEPIVRPSWAHPASTLTADGGSRG